MNNKITNKDYITITTDGVTIGDNFAQKYHGEIWQLADLSGMLEDVQQITKREYDLVPIAMRVMPSETSGRYAKQGNPSPTPGVNAWTQFVFANGVKSPWVFYNSYRSSSDCAVYCAYSCAFSINISDKLRLAVFGPVAAAIKQQKAQQAKKANAIAKNLLLHDLVNRQRFVH